MKKFDNCVLLGIILLLSVSCSKGPKPLAAFAFDRNEGLARDTVRFTNQSNDATVYLWDFGDDSISNAENPNHAYQKQGTYVVSLTATGQGGESTITHEIIVLPSLTGKWSSNFTYFADYNGLMELIHSANGGLTGSVQLTLTSESFPLEATSKISGSSVSIESKVFGGQFLWKGTVNATDDFISGSLFVDGVHSGNWYAIKR
jgi:PKD repeat protein